ncbi:MAG TPA: ABC transporter substrate-binding protein [Gaiellaceae bacterium]|nr:ABC transporter substrate-binding protein [Gaiellaceae bacterium]
MGKRSYIAAGLLGALAIVSGASAASADAPGVTSKEILIGGTIPLTGPASAYASVAKGAAAYFKYVNAHGGVNKRKIKYVYRNDEYDPVKTFDRTRELVQQDRVFAIFNTLGTETNLAIRGYLNQVKVPQLFVASGASTWGRDYKKYPWTIGYQPSYVAEATIYGRYIAKTAPKSRIGVLYQDDDYGKDLLVGLERGLGKKKGLIVSKQGYAVTDDNVRSQIARLKAKRANTLMIFATPKFAIQSYSSARQLGWRPKVYVNAVSSAANIMTIATLSSSKRQTEGSISVVFLKDPTDPRWKRDKAVALFRSILKKYNGGKGLRDVYNVYGMSSAFTMVDALKHAGKNPTRESVMKAATHLNERNNPFVLPGIAVRTTPTNRFPLAQAKLERYHNGRWVSFGPLVSVR